MDNNLGEKIRQLRLSLNISQAELGKLLGFSQRIVSNWEKNEAEPSIETLDKLSKLLNVDFNYLLGKPDYPEIRLSNSDFEWSAWISEKVHRAIKEIIRNNKDEALMYLCKIVAKIEGIKNYDEMDYKLIVQKKEKGYYEFLAKYNITEEDLKKKFTRRRKIDTDK